MEESTTRRRFLTAVGTTATGIGFAGTASASDTSRGTSAR
ncbi:twin-arginine translocation signal domain-containing protein [Halalkalicoccus subterraneus]|nr:twin-arginine translocation signal domain-containing protein [Halalkalicoccus subterraneus]